eukprot:1777645-Alexandrium_andersonii.AAC.1
MAWANTRWSHSWHGAMPGSGTPPYPWPKAAWSMALRCQSPGTFWDEGEHGDPDEDADGKDGKDGKGW